MLIKSFLAFGAGFISFLSPCVLPLIPGYISYISGESLGDIVEKQKKVILKTVLFSRLSRRLEIKNRHKNNNSWTHFSWESKKKKDSSCRIPKIFLIEGTVEFRSQKFFFLHFLSRILSQFPNLNEKAKKKTFAPQPLSASPRQKNFSLKPGTKTPGSFRLPSGMTLRCPHLNRPSLI